MAMCGWMRWKCRRLFPCKLIRIPVSMVFKGRKKRAMRIRKGAASLFLSRMWIFVHFVRYNQRIQHDHNRTEGKKLGDSSDVSSFPCSLKIAPASNSPTPSAPVVGPLDSLLIDSIALHSHPIQPMSTPKHENSPSYSRSSSFSASS